MKCIDGLRRVEHRAIAKKAMAERSDRVRGAWFSPVFDPSGGSNLFWDAQRPDHSSQPSRGGRVKGSSVAPLDATEHGGKPHRKGA
jgi:hypothetical protein